MIRGGTLAEPVKECTIASTLPRMLPGHHPRRRRPRVGSGSCARVTLAIEGLSLGGTKTARLLVVAIPDLSALASRCSGRSSAYNNNPTPAGVASIRRGTSSPCCTRVHRTAFSWLPNEHSSVSNLYV